MNTRTEEFKIRGMSCGHCVGAVKQALTELGGIDHFEVSIGSATVAYDPDVTPRQKIAEAIEEAGYPVESVS